MKPFLFSLVLVTTSDQIAIVPYVERVKKLDGRHQADSELKFVLKTEATNSKDAVKSLLIANQLKVVDSGKELVVCDGALTIREPYSVDDILGNEIILSRVEELMKQGGLA